MHIPPGFLEPPVWLSLYGASAAGVGYAARKTGDLIDERRVPVMGVMAAFIFAAQMVNFPVMGGTSGHVLGSALAVAMFGLWPATIILSAVVIMQALLFQDGGIDALGANVFNMALAGCIAAAVCIRAGRSFGARGVYAGVFTAGWLSVMVSAVLCAFQLAWSGISPLGVVLPAMAAVHAVIGLFEGVITVIVLRFIAAFDARLVPLVKGGGR